MPAARLTAAQKYLRIKCGLPALPPADAMTVDDIDDPAVRLLTTAESAEAAHVPPSTIRDWARARHPLITAAGRDADGNPLYLELEVLEAERRTRRRPRETRLAAEAAQTLPVLSSLGT